MLKTTKSCSGRYLHRMYFCEKSFMENRYARNRLYISNKNQEHIKRTSVLLAGCGLGSNIAECLLRTGFEKITLVDGDRVELSNLNRQNFVCDDIGKFKAEALCERLKSINPEADISFQNTYIDCDNINEIVGEHHIAVNALDFSTDIPFLFDDLCQKKNIPVLHPYNLGWGALVAVIFPGGSSVRSIQKGETFNELNMVEYVSGYLRFWGEKCIWLEQIVQDYKNEKELLPPPQLAIGSSVVAGMCAELIYKIATGTKIKSFPDFYFHSLR